MTALLKTDTYAVFCHYLGNYPAKSSNKEGINLKEYLMNLSQAKKPFYLWDSKTEQVLCEYPQALECYELIKNYEEAEVVIPIITENVRGESYYKYRFFPKLMNKLILDEDILNNLKWPENLKKKKNKL